MEKNAASTAREAEKTLLGLRYYEGEGIPELLRAVDKGTLEAGDGKHSEVHYWDCSPSARSLF